jgi:TIR domain
VSSTESHPYDPFFSYAHRDDGTGLIPFFFERLKAIQGHFCPSEPWWPFLDRPALRNADDWEQKLLGGVSTCGVLVVFLSPAYLASEWCRREWEAFRRQETSRGGERIFPVYLETDPVFEQAGPSQE